MDIFMQVVIRTEHTQLVSNGDTITGSFGYSWPAVELLRSGGDLSVVAEESVE